MLAVATEYVRHTFPKNLRWCKQAKVLYYSLYQTVKQNKDRKYVPREDFMAVLQRWEEPPYAWLRYAGIRHMITRPWNLVRVRRGKKSWLFTPAVRDEHKVIMNWMQSRKGGAKKYVSREQFEREVMACFHVSAVVHVVYILGLILVVTSFLYVAVVSHFDYLLFCYFRYIQKMNREQIASWIATRLEMHAMSERVAGFSDVVPPPASRIPKNAVTDQSLNNSDDMIYMNAVEMTSPDQSIVITFIPFPRAVTKTFCQAVGEMAKIHSSILLEDCSLETMSSLYPIFFFPCNENHFPAFDCQLRYYDIIEKDVEPPRLLYGRVGVKMSELFLALWPMSVKHIYAPYSFNGGREEARTGWGFLCEAIKDQRNTSIAVPWTPFQISNLESSLFKQGWTVTGVKQIPWMNPKQTGYKFCDYFGLEH